MAKGLRERLEGSEMIRRLEELHEEYGIDKVELSKVMIIASTTLMIVSIHAALQFQSAEKKVSEVGQDLSRVSAIVQSSSFQNSLQSIQSMEGSPLVNQIQTATSAFKKAADSFKKVKKVEESLHRSKRIYQWLALIGILGNVAGISLFFI
ncbi:MAG: hypothetical protein ABEJ72_01300 [Candidatus Aenigmatarchaeota archaeon]